MRYRGYGIVECMVLCENQMLADLGLSSDIWLPFTFDMHHLQAIKLAVEDEKTESVQHGCSQLFFTGAHEHVVTDIEYCDMKLLWLAFKTGELPADEGFAGMCVAFVKGLDAVGASQDRNHSQGGDDDQRR
jgi:hypothetical protein